MYLHLGVQVGLTLEQDDNGHDDDDKREREREREEGSLFSNLRHHRFHTCKDGIQVI